MTRRKKARKSTPLDSQSPSRDMIGDTQTLTLSPRPQIPDPQTLALSPRPQIPDPQSPPPNQGSDDPQPMAVSPPPLSDLPPAPPQNPPPSSRKASSKRRKPQAVKKLAEVERKLAFLRSNLRPVVPFPPSPSLDLARHERLFRALGLWDFASLELDRDLRPDLLAELIASYDPPNRRSSVRGARVLVNRTDLARALAISLKKDLPPPSESDLELFAEEGSASVVSDFMVNRMVFLEDACVLPDDVVAASRMVKEGQPHKVDWATLIWGMVEKELQEAPRSGQCYYASHLQRLIKNQHPELFDAKPDWASVAEDEEDDSSALRTASLDDLDNQEPGLSLGIGVEVDGMAGLDGEDEGHWLAAGKVAGIAHLLRRCDSKDDSTRLECEGLGKEEQEEEGGREEERFDDDIGEKFLTSTDLLQTIGACDDSYDVSMHQPLDPTPGEFLAMGNNGTHKNTGLDSGSASQFLFESSSKRELDGMYDNDDDGDGHGMHESSQGNQQKRMRGDGPWEHEPSLDFHLCLEQAQYWLSKSKMTYEEKEEASADAQLRLGYMTNELQEKDQIIRSLNKARMEDQQTMRRYEHELKVMAQVVYGYKKALRETREAFDEYRKQFPQGDEPLYHDVEGPGGIVLSTGDLERFRLERKREMRQLAQEMINDFEKDWTAKICKLTEVLPEFISKVEGLKEKVGIFKQKRVAAV